jgi:SAM-dependent methyltransferase
VSYSVNIAAYVRRIGAGIATVRNAYSEGVAMPDPNRSSGAHRAWDNAWATAEGRAAWLAPETAVRQVAELLAEHGARDVLDIGCGVGRHALFLAQQGFSVTAIDLSPAGLDFVRESAAAAGVEIALRAGAFDELPFPDASFDYALAWNVIYHGDATALERSIAEVWRVLRPGGLFQATLLSKRHYKYGQGVEISPNTFVIPEEGEKGHPHHYDNEAEARSLLSAFQLLELADRTQRSDDDFHLEFLARKPAG